MNIKNFLTPTKKYRKLISSVHAVYRLVNSTFETKDLICRLSRLLCQIFNARYCTVVLLDPAKKYSLFKCTINNGKKYVVDKKAALVDNTEKKILKTFASIRKNGMLAVPLVCEDIMGMIILKNRKGGLPFEIFDQELLVTVCEQVTVGLKNLQLYEEQQKIMLGSIKSLVTLLDTRVPQEYTHSPYFSRLAQAIAEQMHLDEKQIESIKFAALLHDAGKVDIPMQILTKTTKLTPDEYRIIQRHPLKGAQILRPLQALKPVIPIIMHHHEKYNGAGYPSRLKKGQIPLGARIMAVADAFEAMIYGRPYQERKNISSAVREIKNKSGTQFDPKVVEAFLKSVKKINIKKYLQPSKHKG